MFRTLVFTAILLTPFVLNNAFHAKGVDRWFWIAVSVVVLCFVAIFVIELVRVLRSKEDNSPVSDSQDRQPDGISSLPFGADLANAVADSLDAGHDLAYAHPYYCGMGLTRYEGIYVYASVHDGEVSSPKYGKDFYDYINREGGKVFDSRAAFVEWLSVQSDSSLYGDGNQNVTLERLQSFALSRERE